MSYLSRRRFKTGDEGREVEIRKGPGILNGKRGVLVRAEKCFASDHADVLVRLHPPLRECDVYPHLFSERKLSEVWVGSGDFHFPGGGKT